MENQYDLVIRGGTVVDGSGDPPFRADVAVTNGKIVEIGRVPGKGGKEIDARGMIVTPGFVDVHTHYDGQITWEHRLAPSSLHGTTTVVMGNCGVGFAPVKPDQRDILVRLMEGVEDIPGIVMVEGVPWNWQTFPEYLDAIEKRHSDIDFAAQLPHSALRVWVMGERGANCEPASEADLAEMRRLTAEAIKAGAIGVSTSNSVAHRFPDGKPAPSFDTDLQERLALAAGLRDAGSGVYQLTPNSKKPAEHQLTMIRALAEESGRPVSFTVVTSDSLSAGWRDFIAGVERAAQDGLPIRAQILPRPVGNLFGLDLAQHPFSLNPSYQPIAELPLAEKVKAMRDPQLRKRLIAEEPVSDNDFVLRNVKDTAYLFALADPPNYLPRPEDNIRARALRDGIDEREAIYDALLQNDGQAILYHPLGSVQNGRFDTVTAIFDRPNIIVALGDGGAHYGSVCDAAYTTFFLTQYVLGAPGSDFRISIEKAVKMLANDPAYAVGLHDRGLLKQGYKADINVIDMTKLRIHAPHMIHDLPGGGGRVTQKADGYAATIVSGVVISQNGEVSDALPGRLVRHAREQPVATATA